VGGGAEEDEENEEGGERWGDGVNKNLSGLDC
jgi:hypothetical protein